MAKGWSKGLTKETSASVRKISVTMKSRGIDNFSEWRRKARERGLIKSEYLSFEKNGDLAELIGVVLGMVILKDFPAPSGCLYSRIRTTKAS
jgi:hypothetical protein